MNPGLPPNLDLPDATLWHADVFFDVPAFESGVAYGALPNSKALFSARLPDRKTSGVPCAGAR